ncbi:unnamed protein product [Penicillium salamii]|uniref:Poly [ADP-ribose] polymerase n=1 Tax=Penicillium salamii TaxID=1612424 RepID=A0A9W4K742_9EURO|nr:unnamed protein product [Penicillium salamii]CAG8016764.1 unnamed protein product [Penicillium salamii]CAG8246006.1 unnamed protein product [Penicillium salamii]CAG8279414.1 unnamed protein product [Penicillium salamii]CAG8329817.1 unnamed protein product [Penicillium salamii]
MTTDKSVEKLTGSLKELVIGASGKIPGFLHDDIKRLVEECGAKFVDAEEGIKDCTHLITTIRSVHGSYRKVTLADSEGCHIVTMDWFLKTLQKKAPQKVQKYLLMRIKLKNDIETTPSKRGREDDSVKEDNASKKTALSSKRGRMETIRQRNFETLCDLVGYNYEDSDEKLTVWLDDSGFLWDIVLVKFDEQYGAAKYLRLQILNSHDDHSGPSVWLCRYHTRIAVKDIKGEHFEERFKDFASTKMRFGKAFRKFTGLDWDSRDSNPLVHRWIFLKISHGMAPLERETEQVIPEVLAVLRLIFGADYLFHYTAALTARGYSFSFTTGEDKVWFRIALACVEMNLKLGIDNTKKETRIALQKMIYSMVSQSAQSAVSVFNIPSAKAGNFNFDARVFESFDLLLKLQDAFDIMKYSDDLARSLSQIYHSLGLAKMNLVDATSAEFKGLHEYLYNTSSKHHQHQFKNVINIFRLERAGERERFSEWQKRVSHSGERERFSEWPKRVSHSGDRRLLWHGSGCANFAGILTQGLRGGGLVSPNGKSFLPGIYFADMSTKSAGYSGATATKECLIMLCEVELGLSEAVAGRRVGATTHNAWRTAGYIHPDFKNVRVPDINAGTTTKTGAGLYHCEYIAHDPAQVIQRYLFHIKLK